MWPERGESNLKNPQKGPSFSPDPGRSAWHPKTGTTVPTMEMTKMKGPTQGHRAWKEQSKVSLNLERLTLLL